MTANHRSLSAEIGEKTERLVELLGREGLGGVVLNAQHNFAWLTGGARNGIDLSRENGAASLLVTASGKRYILASNIEMPRLLADELSPDLFDPIEYAWQTEKAEPALPLELAAAFIEGELATDISLAPATRTIERLIAKCRFSLTVDETSRIRKLGIDASQAMDRVAKQIRPGQAEIEAARQIHHEFASFGITSVVTLAAADERTAAYRHPVPTEKRFEKLLMLVTCAKRHGLIVSLSRILCVGPIPDEQARKTEAAAYVNASLWHASRVGTNGAQLYQTAADAYSIKGFADEINKHHQGGAAGYKTRDWVAHPGSGEIVQQNQAFAWNPSITGTKIEETVIVSESGIEVITSSAQFPSIPVEIGGTTYYSPGILSV